MSSFTFQMNTISTYVMYFTKHVYIGVKGSVGAHANKVYLLLGPPGITPDVGMLRSGVYNNLTSSVLSSSNQ